MAGAPIGCCQAGQTAAIENLRKRGKGMQFDDGTPVIYFTTGRYVVCMMHRTPDLMLKPMPVSNWEALTVQAEAAVQDLGGLRHGEKSYPCPDALLARVANIAE